MIGKTISHYTVEKELGQGGMGVVYRATDQNSGRIVALKVLNRESAMDADVQRRFLREAGAGAGLVHPSIVQLYESGIHEGQHFLSLEFVDGKNLRDILQDGPLTPRRVVEIGMAVGDALQLAHNNGVVHRDIKAENIMVTADGAVKVMDFGLAKLQNASMLTREGDIVGTIAYMSPEQATGEAVDHRTDIFSFGVLLYELLTGKLPFWAAYETAIVYSILNTEPMSIRELNTEVPEALDRIVFKALRKDRQQRYQKISELTGDLARVKAYFDGERDVLPSEMELVAGAGAVKDDAWGSQIKLAVKTGFNAHLVGREKEFDLLKARLNHSVEGKGQIVFLSGEAGIGKSRLVDELESYGKTLRVRTLPCRCASKQGSYAYQPFVEAIREYLNNKNVNSVETLEAFINELAPGLVPTLPALRVFLDIRIEGESDLGGKEQLWDAVCTLLTKFAQERPLILFVDDLHWADEDTLDLFSYIARNTPAARMIIVGTYRNEDVQSEGEEPHPLLRLQAELQSTDRFLLIGLERLPAEALRDMVASLFPGSDFGPTFYESLHAETEGNPFFAVETLKLLKMEGAIEKSGDAFRLKEDYDRIAIPRSIQDIVLRRIERLKEDEREILEIGAVEGESFHSGTIGSCLELSRIRLLKKLQILERDHHIIHPEEKTYRFDHGKIREFLYDAITPELRVEYHKMIGSYLAETFPGEEHLAASIAYHHLNGGNEANALPFLVSAGEWAKRLFANKQAVEYYQKALEIVRRQERQGGTPAKEKATILEGLADIWTLIGKQNEALGNYTDLLNAKGIPFLKRNELLRKIGLVHANTGDNEKALEVLQQAERELNESGDLIAKSEQMKAALGKTRITRSRVFKSLGRYDEAKQEVEGGLRLMGQEGNLKEYAEALNNLGVIYEDLGAYELAAGMYEKSLKAREELGDKKGVAVGYNNLANVYYYLGDYRRTAENSKKSLDIMTEIGYRAGIAGACNNLGTVYQDQGRYDDARGMHERCLSLRQEIGDKPGVAMSLGNIGSVLIDLGDFGAAKERLEKNLVISREMSFRIFESQVHSWLALASLQLGDAGGALETALAAVRIAEEMDQRSQLASAKRTLGIVRREMLKGSGAGTPESRSAAESDLKESLAIFEELKMQHEAARSCLELAKLYIAGGNRESGRAFLLRAKEVFQKLGALGDLTAANNVNITA
jgi:predicted ATPase